LYLRYIPFRVICAGFFSTLLGIEVGPDGLVYVADVNNHRVQKFRDDGTFVAMWSSRGEGPFGSPLYPTGIAVGPDGLVYVADGNNGRIQKFHDDGTSVTVLGGSVGPYKIHFVKGIALDSRGKVYVADDRRNQIQVFRSGIAWGAHTSIDFRIKVVQMADRLRTDPDYLMAIMAFETGETFSPAILNQANSGAVGLIQFTAPAAQCLKTTIVALGQMTALQQLDYVERYFKECVGPRKLATLADLYMAVLWPRAIGEPDGYVLWQAPDIRYNQNRGLDRNGDGKVTKGEAAGFVQEKLEKGRGADYFG
jgi:hypothetical protein